jgi:hypothetical protein
MLLDGAIGQYIDNNGKTRMINYKVGSDLISLMISPIHPLSLKEDKTIHTISIQKALKFIKDKGLLVTQQDVSMTKEVDTPLARGLWVETKDEKVGIYYGYIPIIPIKPVSGVDVSDKLDPLRTHYTISSTTPSTLDDFRRNRKMAEVLKQYVLYTYANDPENFDETYFVVDKKHVYDIDRLNKKLFMEDNDIIYRTVKGIPRIIVPSDETRDRLMSFLKVSLLNDEPGVMEMKNHSVIENYYQTISDFRTTGDQLVFVNKNGLIRWKHEGGRLDKNLTISPIPLPTSVEPYYYRNPSIQKNALMIIQNVQDGSFERSGVVATKWAKDKVNIGHKASIEDYDDKINYTTYSITNVESTSDKTGALNIPIFEYETGEYAAILFI